MRILTNFPEKRMLYYQMLIMLMLMMTMMMRRRRRRKKNDDDDDEEEEEEEIDGDDDDEKIEEEIEVEEVEENEETNEEEQQQDISDIFQNMNPELLRKYNLDYIKFQHKSYLEIFGIKALQSENLQEFKDNLAKFEKKRILILRIYLLL